ncbi:MAG: peptide deformylase [Acidobacteriota bacterium]
MPGKAILQLGNPLLAQKSTPVIDARAQDMQTLIHDLSDTLAEFRRATGYGRGIAAPQIGILKRAIFIKMQPTGFCSALLNPEIIWTSDERMQLWDDCFSFPDLLVRVERFVKIKVNYVDESGLPKSIEAEGDLSELLQHEIDHLDGILAVERAINPTAFSTRSEWERRYKSPQGL